MIDFRYHLVSIIAVFLALAVGIAVGAEAVSPKVANSLNKEAIQAEKRNGVLNAENNQLKRQISADGAFGQAASGYLLNDLLTDERVVLVTAPGADSGTVAGITAALSQAGAVVTGTVSLSPRFFDADAATEQTLTTAAGELAPPGLVTSDIAGAQVPGQQAAAKVIAAGIMDKLGLPNLTTRQTNSILAGFGSQGFLQTSTQNGGTALLGQATLAVVIAPGSIPANPNSQSAEDQNLALIYLTRDLDLAGKGALLAGSLSGSGNGSAIDAVTSGGAAVSVTTVDNADTVIGQIIVVQALRKLTGPHATATAYGVGPGSAPSPAPTSSPTPSQSPSQPAKKKTVKR